MGSIRTVRLLRWSLLSALGLLPLACGGSTEDKPACTVDGDATSGVVACSEGYSYRATSTRCAAGQVDASSREKPALLGSVDCTNDASVCDAFRLAYCGERGEPASGKACSTGCADDDDCDPGFTCDCTAQGAAGGFGRCRSDLCESDADCEPGYHCASSAQGCGSSLFRCQSADDECFGSADCPSSQFCLDDGVGSRKCGAGSVCGRPFLVQERARSAPAVPRRDWARAEALPSVTLTGLDNAQRLALAQHWTKLGQMEHASIAAFARFSLQLLSLGAPPELVEACTQALADETAHTQLCFGIASAYAGRSIGPGPLDVSGSLDVTSLADIVDLVIAEGCFGETSAALEALEAADTASDPVIAAAYAQIAADEQRHAELAFRFVRWALQREPTTVRGRIQAALHSDFAVAHPALSVAEPCLSTLAGQSRAA